MGDIDENDSGDVSLDELLRAPAELKQNLSALIDNEHLTPVDIFHLLDMDHSQCLMIDDFLDGLLLCSTPGGIEQLQMDRIIHGLVTIREMLLQQYYPEIRRNAFWNPG